MPTLVETNDGYISSFDAAYTTAQVAVTGSPSNFVTVVQVGNSYVAGIPQYQIYRGVLEFNTNGIGAVASATINVWGQDKETNSTYNLVVVSGTSIAGTIVAADFGDLLAETTSYGTISSTAYTVGAWNAIALNGSGVAAINTGGITRFAFRLSKDISASVPAGLDYVQWLGLGQADTTKFATLTYAQLPAEGQGLIAVVGETFHYVSKTGVEYVLQGTPV